MNEDIEAIRFERNDYKRKMDMANQQVGIFQHKVNDLEDRLAAKDRHIETVTKEVAVVRRIMADNITTSNAKINSYISQIQQLQNKLHEVKNDC